MNALYTIGYGRRSIHEFIDLLKQYEIRRMVDIRSHPVSRWNPMFRQRTLKEALEYEGIEYVYLGDRLGGKPSDEGLWLGEMLDMDKLEAQGWFQQGITEMKDFLAGPVRTAVMCAELRPESCHRNWMVGHILHEQGYEIRHIDEEGKLKTQEEVSGY